MKSVIFWGWYSDYDLATINLLGSRYNVLNFSMNKFTRCILSIARYIFGEKGHSRLSVYLIGKKLNKSAVIIFSDDILFYESLFQYLSLPRKIVIFRNKIPKDLKYKIEKLRQYEFEMYTFDESDALYYNIIFKGQYLPCIFKHGPSKPNGQAYFLGLSKGRDHILNRLSIRLKEKGVASDITVVKKYNFGIKFYKGKVSYKNNIKKVIESSYIIDIVREGQTGLTLRALESVFYNRKLITNNQEIKKYDFYNERNILILNDEMDIPDQFLTESYASVPIDFLRKYTAEFYYADIIG